MDETVTAAEANRSFSRLLQGVRAGRRYIVTSHGKPVAEIRPFSDEKDTPDAWEVLLKRLYKLPAANADPWTRDELYDDDP